jgi:NAD(P)-dependent dehydrogenase (short-subunit alcohol dehydrogenase family)
MSTTPRTILITGANSGIGHAAAARFLATGATVALVGRRADAVTAAAKELGAGAIPFTADVTVLSDLDRLAAEVKARLGSLDALVVNAGISGVRPLADSDEAFYDSMFATNTKGAFFTIQKLLPLLKNPSAIVINSSVVNVKGFANLSVYSASKAAVRSFARTLSAELLPQGIRVNVVAPGAIGTPLWGKLGLPDATLQAMGAAFTQLIPAKRFGGADEIAAAIEYLAGPDSAYLAGAELAVDGGLSQL